MSYCARCGAYIPQDEKKCLACGYIDTSASAFGGAAAQAKAPEEDAHSYNNSESSRKPRFENEKKEDETVYYGEVVDGGEDSKWKNFYKKSGGAARRYSSDRKNRGNYSYDFGNRDAYRNFIDKDVLDNKNMAALSYFGILLLIPLLTKRNSPFVRFHLNQAISLFLARIGFMSLALLIAGGLGTFISSLAGVFTFGCAIAGVLSALRGKRKRLPIVGDFEVLK